MKYFNVFVYGRITLPPPFSMKPPVRISAAKDYIIKLLRSGYRVVELDENMNDSGNELTIDELENLDPSNEPVSIVCGNYESKPSQTSNKLEIYKSEKYELIDHDAELAELQKLIPIRNVEPTKSTDEYVLVKTIDNEINTTRLEEDRTSDENISNDELIDLAKEAGMKTEVFLNDNNKNNSSDVEKEESKKKRGRPAKKKK